MNADGLRTDSVKTLEELGLRTVTMALRGLDRSVSGLTLRLGQRASALASQNGSGRSAEEALRSAGKISSAKAKAEARRAEAANDMPTFGAALSSDETSEEHLDALVSAMADLTDVEKARFIENEDDLASAATSTPPETFRRIAK